MDRRALARLAMLTGVAAAAVGVAVHLGQAPAAQPEAATATGATTSGAAAAPAAAGAPAASSQPRDAQRRLLAASRPRLKQATADRMVRVDESQPHVDVFDPQTGGTIAMAEAKGVVKDAARLSPMHADPMPPGVRIADPVDTASLMARADVDVTADADVGQPFAAGASAPVGTPGVTTLRKHVVPSCSGTGTDGNRVQVLYVHESGKASRFSSVLPILRNEVANVDDVFAVSAEQTGGERRVRWVHDSACLPVIKSVTVPKGALGSDFWGTVKALQKLGYTNPHRKYLMFADANKFCGIGSMYGDTRLKNNANDGYAASYARVDANCWSSGHSVAAHELTHTLGGVQPNAPHATKNGHCFDESDIMCYDDGSGVPMKKVCANAQEQLLDCHHDDYFNTHPAPGSYLAKNWDTASSSFLDDVVKPPPPTVTVVADTASAQTGDAVGVTATSYQSVTWSWSASKGCSVTPQSAGHARLVCPSTATGPVTVTATAVATGTTTKGTGTTSVTMTRAAAPTAGMAAPATATTGTSFGLSVTATGKAPFGYAWRAGACTVAHPAAASTTVTCPSSAPTGLLPVSVTVTQADGQRATRSANLALVGTTLPTGSPLSAAPAQPPADAPARTWLTGPRLSGGVLSGSLRDAAGGVAGGSVRVQVRWAGTAAWTDVRTLTTAAGGGFSTWLSQGRAGWFRFAAAADDSRAASVSTTLLVKARTHLAAARSHQRVVGTLTTASGAHVGHARTLLQRTVHGHWRTVATALTDGHGRVSHLVRQSASYRWVFRGQSRLLGTTSRAVRVR